MQNCDLLYISVTCIHMLCVCVFVCLCVCVCIHIFVYMYACIYIYPFTDTYFIICSVDTHCRVSIVERAVYNISSWHMYVCAHIYIDHTIYGHTYINTCIYVYIYIHAYICTHKCVLPCIYIYMYVYIYTYNDIFCQTYVHTHIHTYIHVNTCVCVHMYTCIYIYMYTCCPPHWSAVFVFEANTNLIRMYETNWKRSGRGVVRWWRCREEVVPSWL